MQQDKLALSLGPILFFWQKQQIVDFYQQIAGEPLATIYMGETVCSRRQELKVADWIDLARDVAASGCEVVLSSQVLLESESDLKRLRKLVEQEDFRVEANDLAAVRLLHAKGIPFVAGQALNVYNEQTLALMQSLGACRWVASIELAADRLAQMIAAVPDMACEVFGWGKLPLAYSSRCFTARHYNLKKDSCEFKCLEHADGLPLYTREEQAFLTINGIQTMSAGCHSLLARYQQLLAMGVKYFRISPQGQYMAEVIWLHQQMLTGTMAEKTALSELSRYAGGTLVDGYWQGRAGINQCEEVMHAGA
ncbi:U32 family peptidase [Snodgrassella alvi]|uniref:Ubiquinone biosynthesis protein UbiV n=1 Tax=Snodgrassella alvi TaxID=1196083 RepID=A0A2N9WSN8_9NEIS|nr:U32 family peptidase [Snodgrassella alvi]PIT14235.1 U32 family peptidase [Snodgrassella alvi]PIT16750.1 U32 family peptidase [Snodgrassella alvi]